MAEDAAGAQIGGVAESPFEVQVFAPEFPFDCSLGEIGSWKKTRCVLFNVLLFEIISFAL